jgi:preprotein translocase subunit YajC
VEIAEGVKVKVIKSTITSVLSKTEPAAAKE